MDYELPQASINRIIKNKLPDTAQVGKEAKTAFSKAAGIFILYLTAAANDFCKEGKRQTISAQDVIAALKELEFEEFVTPLEKFLEAHRKQADEARTQKAAAKSGGGGAAAAAGSPTAAAGASDAAEAPAAPATDAADAPMAEAQ